MNVPRWRRGMADVIDWSVALMPVLATLAWWVAAVMALVEGGPAAFGLYAVPAAVFTAPSVWWLMSVAKVRRGETGRRTIGQTVAGLYVDADGQLALTLLDDQPARSLVLRVAATSAATIAVVAFGLMLTAVASAAVGLSRSSDPAEPNYIESERSQSSIEHTQASFLGHLAKGRYEAARLMVDENAKDDMDRFVAIAKATDIVAYAQESSSVGYDGSSVVGNFTAWEYVRAASGALSRQRIVFDVRAGSGEDGSECLVTSIVRSTAGESVTEVPDGTGVWRR